MATTSHVGINTWKSFLVSFLISGIKYKIILNSLPAKSCYGGETP